jgi:hypothetical protein
VKKPIEYTAGVKRFEDMSPTGFLRIMRQTDGDVIIHIQSTDWSGKPVHADIEFCTVSCGGGQSLHTMNALVALIDAMKKDNEERPQYRDHDSKGGRGVIG